MKFRDNPFSGSRVVAWGRMDMIKLIVAFRNFATALKNHVICKNNSNVTKFSCSFICMYVCICIYIL